MPLKINLKKSAGGLELSLQKKIGATTPLMPAEVAFVIDVSGSFEDEHQDGTTNDLLTRLLPWAMVFDPDKKADIFTFSNGENHAHFVGSIDEKNYVDYISKNIIDKVPGWSGGTDYHCVLRKVLKHFGWQQNTATAPSAPKSTGLFGGLFGKKAEPVVSASTEVVTKKRRSLVIFITDGDNGDKEATERLLAESETRKDGVYFLFIGVANGGGSFPFLKKIGDRFNNTGLVVINDLKRFVGKSDEELNDELISSEFVEWLKK